MKNFFKKLSFKSLQKSLKYAFIRFPLSFVSVVLIFAILEFLILQDNYVLKTTEEFLIKGILSLIVVYFLSVWVYLLSEKFNLKRLKICLLQWFVIIFWLMFFFSFPENLFNNFFAEEIVYIIITLIWVISFIFISPFLKKLFKRKYNNDEYYTYFNELFSKIIMAIVIWVSLMLLWFLGLTSIFALFELNFLDEWKMFWTWIAFSLSVFAPLYFLSIVPGKDVNLVLFDNIKENKFINFLVNFIFLPAIIVYFLILYSYTWKVLLNFSSWPEWIISWMIIWFSLLWYLVYIISYVFEEKLSLVRVFRKVLPFAILFQTPMLFYAIYLRIYQYDFTINRYLVVIFWIFLVFISAYFIFSKVKKILYIPTSLTLFIIIISIGPWWVYNFPENRQLNLLEKDLIESWIIKDNEIILPKNFSDLEDEISWKIYAKVTYLCDYHGCDSMTRLLWWVIEEIKYEDKKEWEKNNIDNKIYSVYTWISSWNFKSKLIEKLKVENYVNDLNKNRKYINFRIDFNSLNSLIEVKNYDYLFDINNNSWINDIKNNNLYYAKINIDTKQLTIYKDWEKFEVFDLNKEFLEIYEDKKNYVNQYSEVLLKQPFEIEKIWEKLDIKLILTEFTVLNPDFSWKSTYNYSYFNWKVLVKEK